MARPLRIEFANALYHVTARGNGRADIYLCDDDRLEYLGVLADVCGRFKWVLHAYCLMDNHYHLLIETPDGNLSKGMRQLNGVYTQRFNRKHRRVGHVFQGRYKAILVEKDAYLLELARYIVLNPVRAQMVDSAEEWAWSSYCATAGLGPSPSWLSTDGLLAVFGKRESIATERYRQFVAEGKGQPSIWAVLKNQIYLGSDDFVEQVQRHVVSGKDLSEVPTAQKRAVAKSLKAYEQEYQNRDDAIRQAYASGGYSMKAIGEHFGLHYSTVSRIIKGRSIARFKT